MGDVVDLGLTYGDIAPEKILENALSRATEFKTIIIGGEMHNGDVFFATSTGETALIVYMLEWFKLNAMRDAT